MTAKPTSFDMISSKVFHNTRFPVLFSISLVMFYITSCHSKAERAKVYHDKILLSVQGVVDSSLDYGDALRSYEKQRALQANAQYEAQVNRVMESLRSAGDFEGDTILQKHALEMMGFYQTAIQKDFGPFLLSLSSESLSESERAMLDSLYSDMTMMENQYWARFDWAEKKFRQENKIKEEE